MSDPFDLERLGEIPDPFAGAATTPGCPVDVRGLPASPARSRVRALRLAAVTGAMLLECGWLVVVEHRTDLAAASPGSLAVGLVVPLAAAWLALRALTDGGALGLGERAPRLALLVGLAPLVFLAGTLACARGGDGAASFWGPAVRCMAVTALLTAPPLALGAWAFRRSFVAAAGWRTAALGVASGALAAATMSLACSDVGALHVLAGHGLMMLAGGLLGATLARRITRA